MRYTNVHHLSKEIVSAITNDDYDHPTDDKTIPCSQLIAPPRITILRKRHEDKLVKDVSEEIWSLLGTAVHYILSKQTSDNVTIEQRLIWPINGYRVTGKPDLYNHDTETLEDYKITSVYKVIFGQKEGYKDWTEQLNVYAWLLRKNGLEVRCSSITAILRDWNLRDSKRNADYPEIQIVKIPIEIWSEKAQEEFISQKLETLKYSKDNTDEDLPLCTAEERWASPTSWAIKKDGRKIAVRVFNSVNEAEAYLVSSKEFENHTIEVREGEDRRCANYCPVNQFCSYYQSKGQ